MGFESLYSAKGLELSEANHALVLPTAEMASKTDAAIKISFDTRVTLSFSFPLIDISAIAEFGLDHSFANFALFRFWTSRKAMQLACFGSFRPVLGLLATISLIFQAICACSNSFLYFYICSLISFPAFYRFSLFMLKISLFPY
jgi:hypothetical protein